MLNVHYQSPMLYPDLNDPLPAQPQVFQHIPNPNPPRPQLTPAIHQQTVKLLDRANEMVVSILKLERPPAHAPHDELPTPFSPVREKRNFTPVIDLSNRSRNYNMFNREVHHHHHYQAGNGNLKREKEERDRVLIGIVGILVALGTAFFAGKALEERKDLQNKNVKFEKLKEHWTTSKTYYEEDYQSLVDRIVQRTENILQRRERNKTHKIALLALGFIAGAAAFAGALLASEALIVTGVALGAITGVATLFKLGRSLFSHQEERDAQEIAKALNKIGYPKVYA